MSPKRRLWKQFKKTVKPVALPMLHFAGRVRSGLSVLRYAQGRQHRRASLAGEKERVTLFLAPEAGLEPFFASHALLARVLMENGHKAVLLSCNGLQSTCSAKLANHVNQTPPNDRKHPICVRCRAVAARVGHDYGLVDLPLESILTEADLAEIERIVASNAAAPWDAVHDGIGIGRACLGEAMRTQRKLSIEELSAEDRAFISALLYSSLAIYFAVNSLASRFTVERLVYMGDYAYFIAPQMFAKRHDIPVTNVSHAYNRDIDRRYLNMRTGHAFGKMMEQVDGWPLHKDIPIPPAAIEEIGDGGLYRLYGFGGASTYSPNWKKQTGRLMEELGLPPGGTVLVAYSNSTDELLCNREILRAMDISYGDAINPFDTQLEWLLELAKWVGERPELRLVMRLHPRMAKGHRHLAESSEAAQMRRELVDLPPNVAIVWPESSVSSYNIAEFGAVALTAWSSIGLELARFGTPVVSAFQRVGPWPNTAFNAFATTKDGYFKAVEQALDRAPNLQSILDAYRWTYQIFWTPLVDISDVTPDSNYPGVPPYRSPRTKETLLDILTRNANPIALNMAKLQDTPEAAAAERAALHMALGRALVYFLTGKAGANLTGYRITGARDQSVTIGTESGDMPIFAIENDRQVTLAWQGEQHHRHSPLAVRLARAVAQG